MNGNRWARLDQKVVFFACDAFTKGHNANWIADEVRERFEQPLHRTQSLFKLHAHPRPLVDYRSTAPTPDELATIEQFYMVMLGEGVMLTPDLAGCVSTPMTEQQVDTLIAAADTALKVIKDIQGKLPRDPDEPLQGKKDRPAVHVGFGAGGTTMLVARYLAERLRSEVVPPRVVLHALSSGFNVDDPATAPVAFFNFFHGIPGVKYRGLFASAYVKWQDWTKTRTNVGVRESFAQKDKLHVVITSLASQKDDDGELNRFMKLHEELGQKTRALLDDEEGRVGDVMYLPFSDRGPITRPTEVRAVTLFELDELVAFAAEPNKAVILVAGPCGRCGRSRSDALMPLLVQPSLDVWSHLVIDDRTAMECLAS